MGTDPQGNTAQFLSQIGVSSGDAVNTLSTLAGTLADWSGVITLISFVVQFLNGGFDTQAALDELSAQMQNDFNQLGLDLGTNQLLTQNGMIWQIVTGANDWFEHLPGTLAEQPPISPDERAQQAHDCRVAVSNLSDPEPDLVWYLDYDWRPYWTDEGQYFTCIFNFDDNTQEWTSYLIDCGYGEQAPTREPDGTVFSYSYSLPIFILAVNCMLGVAGALDANFQPPDFPTDPAYIADVSNAAALLQARHDRILNEGIQILVPEPWNLSVIGNMANFDVVPGIRSVYIADSPSFDANTGNVVNVGGVIEYGAVELFSGYSVIESSYLVLVNGSTDTSSAPYSKLNLRALKKAKQVYIDIGLRHVWDSINALRLLIDAPQTPRPNFGDWSFRNDVFPTIGVGPDAATGYLRISDVVSFVLDTTPDDIGLDAAATTVSMRLILSGNDFPDLPTDY